MSDPFSLLGLPRRPFLDEAAIRAAFQQEARLCHPDKNGGDAASFTMLNEAQALLSDPAARLQLLAGDVSPAGMPAASNFGFEVGAGLRHADGVIAKLAASGNAIERAMLAKEASSVRDSLGQLSVALSRQMEAALENLRILDAAWPGVSGDALAALAVDFRFLIRWREQIRERELALSI